jgi:hypothetical protein
VKATDPFGRVYEEIIAGSKPFMQESNSENTDATTPQKEPKKKVEKEPKQRVEKEQKQRVEKEAKKKVENQK